MRVFLTSRHYSTVELRYHLNHRITVFSIRKPELVGLYFFYLHCSHLIETMIHSYSYGLATESSGTLGFHLDDLTGFLSGYHLNLTFTSCMYVQYRTIIEVFYVYLFLYFSGFIPVIFG